MLHLIVIDIRLPPQNHNSTLNTLLKKTNYKSRCKLLTARWLTIHYRKVTQLERIVQERQQLRDLRLNPCKV